MLICTEIYHIYHALLQQLVSWHLQTTAIGDTTDGQWARLPLCYHEMCRDVKQTSYLEGKKDWKGLNVDHTGPA